VGLFSGSIVHSDTAVVTTVVGDNFAMHNMLPDHVANPGTQIIENSEAIEPFTRTLRYLCENEIDLGSGEYN
jgi:hypothetical protein